MVPALERSTSPEIAILALVPVNEIVPPE
jgi:hypothetical protein